MWIGGFLGALIAAGMSATFRYGAHAMKVDTYGEACYHAELRLKREISDDFDGCVAEVKKNASRKDP